MNGYPGQPPVRVGSIVGDLAASFYATIGILAALREVERSGVGQRVDISQQDSVVTLTESAIVNYTVDGKVADAARQLASVRPALRPVPVQGRLRLLRLVQRQAVARQLRDLRRARARRRSGDRHHGQALRRGDLPAPRRADHRALVHADRTKAELEAMAGNRIALTPIKSIDEVVADPHLRAREMFVQVPHGRASRSRCSARR